MNRWLTFTPSIPDVPQIAAMWGIPVLEMAAFFDTYITKFRAGPEVFWPWYAQQRMDRSFEPPHPYEVFPQLMEDDCGFYQFIGE